MSSSPAFALSATKTALRDLPRGSYLLHATNCLATWGAGIAAELATIFPAACEVYEDFCNRAKASPSARWPPRSLVGRCLVIPPQERDVAAGAPEVYVVCLFTSYGFGRANPRTGKPGRDGVNAILEQTRRSLGEFKSLLEQETKVTVEGVLNDKEKGKGKEEKEMVIYSPMFNSGAFKVPWDRTTALIEEIFDSWHGSWVVLEPPS